MSRPRIKCVGKTGIPRLMMSEWCYVWCNICGGVLDTDNEGGRRSDMRHLKLNESSDYGESWDDYDDSEPIGDRFNWGEAYYSIALSEADTEWLLHFRVFGLNQDDLSPYLLWSPEATNESTTPGLFLSQEANLEESRGGEIFYVPRTSEGQASGTGISNDFDSDFDDYWMHKGWTRLQPPDGETPTVGRAVAHSHCLDLFHRFTGSRYHGDNEKALKPTTMRQLLRAFELRQMIYQDACHFCDPSPIQPCGMACWQHCFFGAQEAGWGQQAWISHAGDELYCADPIKVPRLKEFIVSCCEMPPEMESAMQGPANKEITQGPFDLPIEIFEQVCWCLDLRSVCAIRSTCHRARERLAHLPTFWRVRTIGMHGDWFWELSEAATFPPRTTNWMQLLWEIELARTEILQQAGFVRGGRSLDHLSNHKLYEETIYRPKLFDGEGRQKLPLGLKNRLRIWCCLQSIGKDGTQIKLPGQKKGLDLPRLGWNGVSNHADCPSCGHKSAISFNRMKIIAGG